MKIELYRPDHDLDALTLLEMSTELMINDARIEDAMLRMAPGDVAYPPSDPEDLGAYVPSDHERIVRAWREILPNRNDARDLYDLRLEYGWTKRHIDIVVFACEEAAQALRDRAQDVPLKGTKLSLQYTAGLLTELALRWEQLRERHAAASSQ